MYFFGVFVGVGLGPVPRSAAVKSPPSGRPQPELRLTPHKKIPFFQMEKTTVNSGGKIPALTPLPNKRAHGCILVLKRQGTEGWLHIWWGF